MFKIWSKKKHWLSSVFVASFAPCRNRTCNYSL